MRRRHEGHRLAILSASDTGQLWARGDTSRLVGGRTADCLAESLWSLLLQDMVGLLRGDPYGQRETDSTSAVCGA